MCPIRTYNDEDDEVGQDGRSKGVSIWEDQTQANKLVFSWTCSTTADPMKLIHLY